MTSRTNILSLLGVICVALSACSTTTGEDQLRPTAGGAIELAVSETCSDESDPQCISVNGESVVFPSAFERAGVDDAVAIDGQNAIALTLNADGAEVLRTLTEQAAEAADTARLVIAIGDEILTAARVIEPLTDATVHVVLPPDRTAQDLITLIREN
ncbi:hypothetical protein [Microcella humidisoli]|uniref:Preprotein translocase subunit SecD n=1 Tax=Microcella humidisoli TaxID=2963406 RepID=A0ABY5FU00_9MICO|nr:hypothetical protein [Microcella humidisoli]UTT61767.1 hypothetical protein NNL39_08755 [Microcella humidisoli]